MLNPGRCYFLDEFVRDLDNVFFEFRDHRFKPGGFVFEFAEIEEFGKQVPQTMAAALGPPQTFVW